MREWVHGYGPITDDVVLEETGPAGIPGRSHGSQARG
jgi:hypothetical protein